jgi:hypothetical protein
VRSAVGTILFLVSASFLLAAGLKPEADTWLTNAPALPSDFYGASRTSNLFHTLRAEVIAERLRVSWESTAPVEDAHVVFSADAPGHWPARDWRSLKMQRHGTNWQAEFPVDSLNVPLVYFLLASNHGEVTASPMRVARPRALGLEQSTRLFWSFIEGFEQGLEGWRVLHGPPLRTHPAAKHGRSALALQIPSGQRSITVATTRLRGWFLQEHRAAGIELWMRTRGNTGAAAFELMANAFSTNQVIARRADATLIGPRWSKIELPFSRFPKFPLGDLDMISIELTGEPGTEFLLDDVALLRR